MYERVITITEEMQKGLRELSPYVGRTVWTKEAEDFLYENYERYRKRDLAKLFGLSDKTLFKKYSQLREERNHEG